MINGIKNISQFFIVFFSILVLAGCSKKANHLGIGDAQHNAAGFRGAAPAAIGGVQHNPVDLRGAEPANIGGAEDNINPDMWNVSLRAVGGAFVGAVGGALLGSVSGPAGIFTEAALVSGAGLGAGMAICDAAGVGVGAVLGAAVTALVGARVGEVGSYSEEELRAQLSGGHPELELVREGRGPETAIVVGGVLGAVIGTTIWQAVWAKYRQLNALPRAEARLVLRRDIAAIRAVRLGIRILSGNVDSDSSSSSSSSDSDSD